MRSWALRILDTETISMAFVIFFVFSKLLIWPRISLPVAIVDSLCRQIRSFKSSGEGLLEGGDGVGQLGFGILVQGLGLFDLVEQCRVAGLEELVQTMLERQNLLHFEVIQETLVDSKQRGTH